MWTGWLACAGRFARALAGAASRSPIGWGAPGNVGMGGFGSIDAAPAVISGVTDLDGDKDTAFQYLLMPRRLLS